MVRKQVGRREFLGGMAASALPFVAGGALSLGGARIVRANEGTAGPTGPAGLIIREREPLNLESPFAALKERITPTHQFFVRSHFPVPKLEVASWRLNVEGVVKQPLELSYDELQAMPATTITATIECAGNGRALLAPKVPGVAWQLGAVGNATWTGVPLEVVLRNAMVRPEAVEVVLEGADEGVVNDEPRSPGVVSFARSLPLKKARRPEVMLAYQMNGQDLTPEHGFPLRAVVAGWYGMASIKWLRRLIVTDKPFEGYWQTFQYSHWQRNGGPPVMRPVSDMQVKSSIARPAFHEHVPAGKTYRVFGAAWAGESEIARVELSTDGGTSWHEAKLLDDPVPFAWRLWEFQWQVPQQAGRYTLMAKATDREGRTQPPKHDPDRRSYMINFTAPVEVVVA